MNTGVRIRIKFWVVSVLFSVMMAIFNVGCATKGRILVLEHTGEKVYSDTVEIRRGVNTVNVPEEYLMVFENKLKQKLYSAKRFAQGHDLTMTYRFIECDKGNRFVRWAVGYAGEGSMTVEVTYTDSMGKELAKIQSQGAIAAGFFGGDFKDAIEKAAKEIADYNYMNFK